jgi:hypothetical protein
MHPAVTWFWCGSALLAAPVVGLSLRHAADATTAAPVPVQAQATIAPPAVVVPAVVPSMQDQQICRNQAERVFKENHDGRDEWFFRSSVSTSGMCFIVEGIEEYKDGESLYYVLSDAFTGELHGQFMWHSAKDKKWWDVPPTMCTLGGKTCSYSGSDWWDAAMQYMTGRD